MPKVALGDLLGDPLGGKEGRKGVRTGSTGKRKSNMAMEKGRFKHIGHYQALQGISVLNA